MPLSCYFLKVKMVKFTLCVFYHSEAKIFAKVLKSIEQESAPAYQKGLAYG